MGSLKAGMASLAELACLIMRPYSQWKGFFSSEVECLYGNLLFASSVLKVDCKGSVYENIWNMSPKELDTCIKLIELFKTLE